MNDELNEENLNKVNEVNSSTDHETAATSQNTMQPNLTMNQTPQHEQNSMYQQNTQYDQAHYNSQMPNSSIVYPNFATQGTQSANAASMNTAKEDKKAAKKAAKAAKTAQRKKNGAGRRFVKKSIALVSAAAVFGVIAGAGFQGVSYLMNHESKSSQGSAVLQAIDEFGDNITNAENNASSPNGTVVSTNSDSAVIATDVSDVAANVMPSIVSINCTSTMTEYDFFGRQYQNEVSGSGSGIIIGQSDDELLIATNNHVVEGAKALEIVFTDEAKVLGTVKGTEPNSDLAVVSVKMSDIKKDTLGKIRIATLGDSDKVKPGEMVIAIGNALGYGQSVTVGYVSALNREVTTETTKMNLLQTDAAINPGNSGGALINAHGEIIGINSVKYARTDVEGVGYAIPTATAIPIFNELMNREDLTEDEMGYIGIVGKNIEESFANAFNMPVGISIDQVAEDSPAEKAGLKKGEIIVGINGKKIETMQDLQNTLSYTRAGTKVTLNLKVLTDGKYIDKDVEVTLAKREAK